jgi:hypothetical protein
MDFWFISFGAPTWGTKVNSHQNGNMEVNTLASGTFGFQPSGSVQPLLDIQTEQPARIHGRTKMLMGRWDNVSMMESFDMRQLIEFRYRKESILILQVWQALDILMTEYEVSR